jgi:hypothetical protein
MASSFSCIAPQFPMWYHAERQQKTVSQCSSGRLTRSASMSRSCAFLIQRRSLGSGSLGEAYIYTPFIKKVLHITKGKRKSNVQHDCKSNDFRAGFKVAKWRVFCHSAWSQISPARFKQVYSDKTYKVLANIMTIIATQHGKNSMANLFNTSLPIG